MLRLLKVLDVSVFLGFAAVVFAHVPWNPRTIAGLLLAFAGLTLWMVARWQLGRSFAVRAVAQKLVTHGLYSRVRHPVYVFAQLGYAGVVLAWGNWIGVVLLIVIWLGQWRRMKREEAVLEKAFGDEYRRYRAATWF